MVFQHIFSGYLSLRFRCKTPWSGLGEHHGLHVVLLNTSDFDSTKKADYGLTSRQKYLHALDRNRDVEGLSSP